MAKEVIRHGGAANLAETDELIGAEPYVLENVRDAATARAFLEKIEAFKRYAANHGATAEGNPTGGNNFRGLYNIALKSLGAAAQEGPRGSGSTTSSTTARPCTRPATTSWTAPATTWRASPARWRRAPT